MTHKTHTGTSTLERVRIEGTDFFKISNSDVLRPFLMSIVSDSNHWMYTSSNGGLTAGRKDAEHALFPYYSDDKIEESAETTGSKSIFRVVENGVPLIWEPFSCRTEDSYAISRNLYKSSLGNKVIFEEINHDLLLTFQYQWNSSNRFGFVRKASLYSHRSENVHVSVLDGIQNILPCGVESEMQKSASNLVDAYKRSELIEESGLGIYALSSIITDKAEPSEALKANTVWSCGILKPTYLLSSLQLRQFRSGHPISQESDIKAEKGAYFIHTELSIAPKTEKKWMIVANVNLSHAAITRISDFLRRGKDLEKQVDDDIALGSQRLAQICAGADGLQNTSDQLRDHRHYSNVLFNVMRGGVFDHNYQIEQRDFSIYLQRANNGVFDAAKSSIVSLPVQFSLFDLKKMAETSKDMDFLRLSLEYLPLKFSRRHGDPSRPWNKFSINTRNEIDGSQILDYEGNWRDIFQNWEALVHSYPEFIGGMLFKFLNATTFDGYNPYRVTKDGFDWETIEPENPWSYIGYWGDHQIIYLLKLMEFSDRHYPGMLEHYFDQSIFVYANVPYKIKSFQACLRNPKNTIDFDFDLDRKINQRRREIGADGALLTDESQAIYKVNLIEKLLATILAKLSNFVPEGGIWMSTQRPEWNDANNALVGNGVSMVTLYYLRRFLRFLRAGLHQTNRVGFQVSNELTDCYTHMKETFVAHQHLLKSNISDKDRGVILGSLAQAASDYREHIYKDGFRGRKTTVSLIGLRQFVDLSIDFIEHSIRANKRQDHLYHTYNLMSVAINNGISISHLDVMLEGQVAVLSSGYLTSDDALALLDSLKNSKLYREDQDSYLLYPNKILPGFIDKNNIPPESVKKSALLCALIKGENREVIEKNIHGKYHFNGNLKNARDLSDALSKLSRSDYADLVAEETELVLQIFEEVFNHKAFTGRSGTFFGYEGLGSIYWHMVSKLQLAVMECIVRAIDQEEDHDIVARLLGHYYEINEGIGVHKSPATYGAFPTDPYSHTPAGKGAQQPGMTGQVKEDILSRIGELGVFIRNGRLHFHPRFLRKDEFLTKECPFEYVDINKKSRNITLSKGSLGFTYCQVPVVYTLAKTNRIIAIPVDNLPIEFDTFSLDKTTSQKIFRRTGDIIQIIVHVNLKELKCCH